MDGILVGWSVVLLLFACAPSTPPQGAPMDGIPDGEAAAGPWRAAVVSGALTVSGGGIERQLGPALPELAFFGDQLAYPAPSSTGTDLLLVSLPEGVPRLLTDWPGYEDRPVFSPDGTQLAFFSGRTGLASLYLLDLATGEISQRTNVGLESAPRRHGRPPDGFVPPPGSDLRWEADISWVAAGQSIVITP